MSTECAICYVSSVEYLLPSIVSAASVRRSVPKDAADIFIFMTSRDEDLIRRVNDRLRDLGIVVQGFDGDTIKEMNDQPMEGYITSTTLGRFFIGDLVPQQCRRIIYIDGDTWARGNFLPLVAAEVPEGKFAAAEDVISFRANSPTKAGRRISAYFAGLGIDPRKGYFNSGVFAVSKKTWLELSANAFEFFKNNRDICINMDQSALNKVLGDRRLQLSLRWNFQSPARFMGIEASVDPVIYHFNQYIKPWMGVCKPWEEVYKPYSAEVTPFASLGLTLPMVDAKEIVLHNKLSPLKNILLDSPLLASIASLGSGVRTYEKGAWL